MWAVEKGERRKKILWNFKYISLTPVRSRETSPWKPEHACYHGDPFKPAEPLHLDAGRTVNMPGQLMWQSDFSCWSESFIDIWTISRYCHYFKMLGRMPFERLPLFSSFLSLFFACFLIFPPFSGLFIGEGFPAVQFKTSGIGPMSRKLLSPHLQCWVKDYTWSLCRPGLGFRPLSFLRCL